jgi:ubiquinone/menaquinone biosynthesis C-methylase UbiE
MKRSVVEELLDHDNGTPEQIAAALADLKTINRFFGGTRSTTSLLQDVSARTGKKEFSLLEIGSGRGDVPLHACQTLGSRGIAISVTLLDRNWTHLPPDGVPSVAGDALRLPFRDNAFDVVSCSLFAHHFDHDSLRRVLNEALRVSRAAVVVNDLVRSRLHLLLVYLWIPFFRSRLSWTDGPASVRAAYTFPEMKAIVEGLSTRRISISRYFLFRMGVIIEK